MPKPFPIQNRRDMMSVYGEKMRLHDQLTIRVLEPAAALHDAKALVALINASDRLDRASLSVTLEQLLADLEPLTTKPRDEVYLAERNGRLVGYVRLIQLWTEEGERFVCRGIVAPDQRRRGIGTRLVQHALARARQLKSQTPCYFDVSARRSVPGVAQLAESLGLRPVRWFLWMRRSFQTPLPAPVPPPGVQLRPFVVGQDEAGYVAVYNAAFQTHFGAMVLTSQELPSLQERGWFEPRLTVVAESGGDICGLCAASASAPWLKREDGDWAIIEDLAVAPAWQRRGLGRALLLAGMQRLRAAGYLGAYLGVDVENVHQARRLYESVGFIEVGGSVVYRMEI